MHVICLAHIPQQIREATLRPTCKLAAGVLMRRCLLSVSATIGFTTRNGMAYDVSMYMVECCSAPVAMLEVGRERRVGI